MKTQRFLTPQITEQIITVAHPPAGLHTRAQAAWLKSMDSARERRNEEIEILRCRVRDYSAWVQRRGDPRVPVYRARAEEACRALLQKDDSYEAQRLALNFYRSQGNHTRAAQLLQGMIERVIPRAGAVEPRIAHLYRDLGLEYQALGRLVEAKWAYQESLRRQPLEEERVRTLYVALLRHMNRPEAALRVETLEKTPGNR